MIRLDCFRAFEQGGADRAGAAAAAAGEDLAHLLQAARRPIARSSARRPGPAAPSRATKATAGERDLRPAPGRGGRLGRDRRPDRGLQRVPLGVPLGGSGGASGLADAGRLGGARDDGRAPARGVALGPLHRPAGARGGHQTCLAHLARDVAYAVEVSDDPVPFRLQLWLDAVFALADASPTWPPRHSRPSAGRWIGSWPPSWPRRAAAI